MLGEGQPSPARMERVDRAIEGLVYVAEMRVVEDKLIQLNPEARVAQNNECEILQTKPSFVLWCGQHHKSSFRQWTKSAFSETCCAAMNRKYDLPPIPFRMMLSIGGGLSWKLKYRGLGKNL